MAGSARLTERSTTTNARPGPPRPPARSRHRVAPAVAAGTDHAVHEGEQGAGADDRPRDVETPARPARVGQQARRGREEQQAPIGRLMRNTQRQEAYSVSTPPRTRPRVMPMPAIDAVGHHRAGTPWSGRHQGGDQRQGGRCRERRAESLARPGGQECLGALGEAGHRRGDGEQRDPDIRVRRWPSRSPTRPPTSSSPA